MGYYAGLPPARTEEDIRTAPERHAKLQAEWDACRAAELAHMAEMQRGLSPWRRFLCRMRWGCRQPENAKWGEWFCRHCGRLTSR